MDTRSIASRLKELLQFLSTTKGDLANVTGPPAMLAPSSVVEVGHCWAQRPAVFAAPALEPAADRRCLLVLRMVLIALRSQLYVGGGSPATSIKKPLNAFLGELFLAEWTEEVEHECSDEATATTPPSLQRASTARSSSTTSTTSTTQSSAQSSTQSASLASSASSSSSSSSSSCPRMTTRLVAEQVSHHPPITAMHIADEAHGVRADGYARVEMTFAGSVQVRQVGHAILRVDRFDEEYLIPLPDVKVRGFLAGRLYPEVTDTYHIVGSSGYAAEIRFSGQGLAWGGKKNGFSARVYGPSDDRPTLYSVDGVWSAGWTVTDARTGAVLERYVVDAPHNAPAPMALPPVADMDPWESRRAWGPVINGITAGNLGQTVAEKSKIEQAQRRMRAHEAAAGQPWEPLFFRSSAGDAHHTFHRLAAAVDGKTSSSSSSSLQLRADRTKGVWRIDKDRLRSVQRPFRGPLTPLG